MRNDFWFFLRRLLRITWINIKVYRMRVFLTVLGIVIGTVCVISTFSMNKNLVEMIKTELARTGGITLLISGVGDGGDLKAKDLEAIQRHVDNISEAYVVKSFPFQPVNYKKIQFFSDLVGVDYGWTEARSLRLKSGRSLQPEDAFRKVAVIGSVAAKEMFGNANPIGQYIRIGKIPKNYRIIGVLQPQLPSPYLPETIILDTALVMPQQVLINDFGRKSNTSFYVKPRIDDKAGELRAQIMAFLKPKFQQSLNVSDPSEIIRSMEAQVKGVIYAGTTIGLLCLITGGIGIMNIMLVSVMQRKKEIGLYKALGYTNRLIGLQFIVEALSISLIGDIIGIIGGIPAASLLSAMVLGSNFGISYEALVITVIFSLVIGVLFGYLPARNAAKMNPMEAIKG